MDRDADGVATHSRTWTSAACSSGDRLCGHARFGAAVAATPSSVAIVGGAFGREG